MSKKRNHFKFKDGKPIGAVIYASDNIGRERFELKSIHFQKLNVVLYDNVEKKELSLSIYELVDLLNDVSQSEYSLLELRDDIYRKLDGVVGND